MDQLSRWNSSYSLLGAPVGNNVFGEGMVFFGKLVQIANVSDDRTEQLQKCRNKEERYEVIKAITKDVKASRAPKHRINKPRAILRFNSKELTLTYSENETSCVSLSFRAVPSVEPSLLTQTCRFVLQDQERRLHLITIKFESFKKIGTLLAGIRKMYRVPDRISRKKEKTENGTATGGVSAEAGTVRNAQSLIDLTQANSPTTNRANDPGSNHLSTEFDQVTAKPSRQAQEEIPPLPLPPPWGKRSQRLSKEDADVNRNAFRAPPLQGASPLGLSAARQTSKSCENLLGDQGGFHLLAGPKTQPWIAFADDEAVSFNPNPFRTSASKFGLTKSSNPFLPATASEATNPFRQMDMETKMMGDF